MLATPLLGCFLRATKSVVVAAGSTGNLGTKATLNTAPVNTAMSVMPTYYKIGHFLRSEKGITGKWAGGHRPLWPFRGAMFGASQPSEGY